MHVIDECSIRISVDGLIDKESYEHASVYAFENNIRKDISFNHFCNCVKQSGFRIYLTFYSSFAKGLLINGFLENLKSSC